MLEFHQFELAGHQMESWDVASLHDLGHRAAFRAVADCPVKGFILADVEFGLMAEQRRKAGLRIEVDGENSIAAEREILGEMSGCSGFSAPPFKIHHRDDLEGLRFPTMRRVSPRAFS